MANVRFITPTQNRGRKVSATSTFPKLINGNGAYSGAPALVEDAAFPMANLLDQDRAARVYVSGPSPANSGSDLVVELDIASGAQSVVAVGVLGFERMGSSVFPSSMLIEYLPGNTYSPTGWIADIPAVTLGRDCGAVFTARSARFWRLRFIAAGLAADGFTFASPFVAAPITDLGFLYSQARETVVTPKAVVEGYGGTPVITRTGRPYRRFELDYANTDAATKATFDALNALTSPFVYLAPDGGVYECVPDGGDFRRAHIWAPPDRFQFTFAMRSLP